MSAQPQPPQQNGGPPPTPEAQSEQRVAELLEQVLGGELPGEGYLFASSPEERQQTLIRTTPEFVREALLRAIEVLTFDVMLPYGALSKGEAGKAILELGQTFLLLDPSLDENGMPVGAQAQAQGEAQVTAAEAQANGEQAVNEHKHGLELAAEAARHGNAMALEEHKARLAHQFPPRVQPNAAEKKLETEEKPKAEALKGARADRPLPRPRVGQ